MGKKKNTPLAPRRKRMNRAVRLQAARHWVGRYRGKNLVRGYARWFGVDRMCAAKELEILGVPLDPVYLERLRITCRERSRPRPNPLPEETVGDGVERDEFFSYIAGYTSGGAPYGIPWESTE